MAFLTGTTVRGYEIREELGTGSHGVVYRAYQTAINRYVAIKRIHREFATNESFAQRFAAEARMIAHLEHPHIVPLYDFWHDSDGVSLVMRLVGGGSLRQVVSRQQGLSLAQCVRIGEHIADALAFVHQRGVIHRDIKPENILLDERGNAYLSDFSIAILKDDTTPSEGGISGTAAYLAPEQGLGKPVTPQSDIYSFGVVLYEMLTGQHPYGAGDFGRMLISHIQEPMPSLLHKRPDLPAAVDNVIQRATAKDAAARYDSIEDLAAELRECAMPFRFPSAGSTTSGAALRVQPQLLRTAADRNRHNMLQNVRLFWIQGVLENSLHGAALIQLGMKNESGAIDHPWDVLLQSPSHADETLPPGTPIVEVFDRLNGKLLILGEPGSGKTTTMLDLARSLLSRAECDSHHPIPVILNLSSWGETQKPLTDWLVDELSSKYQVPRRVAGEWVENDELLLLLDGLDEVASTVRDACVEAINAYRSEHGFVDVVVCSRVADYHALTGQLRLNGAISLMPLTPAQVDAFLGQLGPRVESLQRALKQDETLHSLSHSPLTLSIMVLAYEGDVFQTQPAAAATTTDQRARLFDIYLRRMFERRLGAKPYTQQETTTYLAWLARAMRDNAQSVFLIEKMQPAWLSDVQRRHYYRASRLIYVASTALIYSLPCLLIPPISAIPGGLMALMFAITGAVMGWILSGNGAHWHRISYRLVIGAMYGLAYGIGMGLGYGAAVGLSVGVGFAVAFALGSSALIWFLSRTSGDRDSIAVIETLRFSPTNVRLWAGLLGLGFGVMAVFGLTTYWPEQPIPLSRLLLSMLGNGGTLAGLFLFLSGLTGGEVELRTRPNQGIWSSLGNALHIWTIAMLVFLAQSLTGAAVATGSVAVGLAIWLATTGGSGYPFALSYGAFSVLKHIVLRYVLYKEGVIPRNYAHFLDYATDLILMRRVGGGYIFIHRYLLEHFASLQAHDPALPKHQDMVCTA